MPLGGPSSAFPRVVTSLRAKESVGAGRMGLLEMVPLPATAGVPGTLGFCAQMARDSFQGLRNLFSGSVLPEWAVQPVCAPAARGLAEGGYRWVHRGMELGSMPVSTRVCARPLGVQAGAVEGRESGGLGASTCPQIQGSPHVWGRQG